MISWNRLRVQSKTGDEDLLEEIATTARRLGIHQVAVRHASGAHVEMVLGPPPVTPRGGTGVVQDQTRAEIDSFDSEMLDSEVRAAYSSNYENPALWPGGVIPTLESDEPAPKLKGEKESE